MTANSETKSLLKNWAQIIFVCGCAVGFFVALVLALEFPLKFALIVGLTPIGILFILLILLLCIFKWDLSTWREHYANVSNNETYTRVIKTVLLPLLLGALYLYLKREDGENTLYTKSPVSCEMTIHPCGSSFKVNSTEVWDAADLISQPSENEVFIVTNAVDARNQTRRICPQTGAYCSTNDINPGRRTPKWLEQTTWTFSHQFSRAAIWNPISCPKPDPGSDEPVSCTPGVLYDNGIQTGLCENTMFCAISGWCDPMKLSDFPTEPIFHTEDFTLFLDLKPNFPEFKGVSWTKGGEDGGYSANYADIYAKHYKYERSVSSCLYHPVNDAYCPRFRLQDIVMLANGEDNFKDTATYGGMFKIEVEWRCQFDWGQTIYDCFPNFKFINKATNKGKPKIYPKITSQTETSRTVTYSLGINVSVSHFGRGHQIQLFNLVIYAQFIYVSFQMIKGPFLWIIRCLIATSFMFGNKNTTVTVNAD